MSSTETLQQVQASQQELQHEKADKLPQDIPEIMHKIVQRLCSTLKVRSNDVDSIRVSYRKVEMCGKTQHEAVIHLLGVVRGYPEFEIVIDYNVKKAKIKVAGGDIAEVDVDNLIVRLVKDDLIKRSSVIVRGSIINIRVYPRDIPICVAEYTSQQENKQKLVLLDTCRPWD